MSTILKALRRLEEEKSRGGSQRPLREEVASGSGELQAGRRWSSWLPVLALLLGAGAGASAWWLWPYERIGAGDDAVAEAPRQPESLPTPPPVASPPVIPGIPADMGVAVTVAPDAAEERNASGPPEDAFASDVEVVERPAPTPRIQLAPEAKSPAPARPLPAAPPDPKVQPPVARVAEATRAEAERAERAAAAKTAAPEPSRVARAPLDVPPPAVLVPEPAPAPEPAFASEPAPEPPAPKRSEPAPVTSAAVSPVPGAEITVTRTQWHPEPMRRSADVRIDGRSRSVHEGDVVSGYEVSEIRPSGVVLTRDGERIEQKIGKR